MIDPVIIRLAVDTSAAAESVREFVTETKQALDTGLSGAVDRAKKKLEELARQQQVVNDTIGKEKQAIEELQKRRETAHGIAKKEIDEQISGLQKVIENRKLELVSIDQKKTKLQEITALSTATSEAEKNAIRQTTDQRLIELNVLRDTQKAHGSVNEEMSTGIPIGRNFLTVMGGWAIVNGVLSIANSYLAAMRAEMEGINSAGEKMRGLATNRFQQERSFFAENGLRTADAQNAGRQVLDKIAAEQGIPRESVLGTAAALSPVFKKAGIAYDSAAGRSLIGHGSRFAEQGVDSQAIADLAMEELKRNPNLTGEQFNQRLSGLMETAGGTPSRLNSLLEIYQTNRPQYEAVGLGLNDAAKMYGKLGQNTSPAELPNVARMAFRSLDRLLGQSPQQLAALHKSLGNYGPMQSEIMGEQEKLLTPERQIELQEKMRDKGSAIPELDALFTDAVKNKKDIDVRALINVLGKLDKDKLNRVDRAFGGSRGIVALGRAAGFSDMQMPQNPALLPAPQAPEIGVQVQQQQAEAAMRQLDPPVPEEAGFQKSTELEADYLQHHPEFQQGISHGVGFWMTAGGGFGLGYANLKEQGAARTQERELLKIARTLAAIRSGKIKASPSQIDALESSGSDLRKNLGMGEWGTDYAEKWSALTRLSGVGLNGLGIPLADGPKADDLLKEIDTQGEDSWITANQTLHATPAAVTNPRIGGKIISESEKAIQDIMQSNKTFGPPVPPPAPVPGGGHAMAPMIFNQQRIVNYGYGFDSIGAAGERDTRMG